MINKINTITAILEKILQSKWLIISYLTFYFIVITLVSLFRWWQFEYYYFDHGIFDSSLWQVAQGQWPMIDHFEETGFLNQLGDHFTPSLYLLTPLYWITAAYEPLILLQNIFVLISAAVMWVLSAKLKVSIWLRWALLIAYTWFAGFQNGLIAGFHTELPALATLAGTFFALETKRWRLFWLLLLITLGFKELFVGIVVGLGIYLIFNKQRAHGFVAIVVSLVYYWLVTEKVIPYFSGKAEYDYVLPQLSVQGMLTQFFVPIIKLKTFGISLLSFGLLPLASFAALPLLLQDFVIRFIFGGPPAWDFGYHYSLITALLLYFSSLKGAVFLQKFKWYQKFIIFHAALIILITGYYHLKLDGALGLSYNPVFYQQTQATQFLDEFVQQIPNTGLVMTQNNLAVHLTHTHKVILLRDSYWRQMPDVVALDIRAGQSPLNYWPIYANDLYDALVADPNYQLHEVTEDQVFFTKNADVDETYYLHK